MANRELPQLTPDPELSSEGVTRLEVFLTSLRAAPTVMQAILARHAGYASFMQAPAVEKEEEATLAGQLAEIFYHGDDIFTIPDDATHRQIDRALEAAKRTSEDGKLLMDDRRFLRLKTIVGLYATHALAEAPATAAHPAPEPAMAVDTAAETFPLDIPLQRAPLNSVSQAA